MLGEGWGKGVKNESLFTHSSIKRLPTPHFDLTKTNKIGRKGRAYAEFVIDTSGKVNPADLKILYISDDALYQDAVQYFSQLEFDPAEHHPGCIIPFKARLGVDFE
ncbi:MAG: hypothetical protein ACU837_16850 [Gammaproteobacteria bacterium]